VAGPDDPDLLALVEGLSRPLPEISCKHFYDDRGSQLFEDITQTEEYYPTRTELAILEENAARIVEAARPRALAELGAGAGRKIGLLLDEMASRGSAKECVLLDVNASFLAASAARLRAAYPGLAVREVVGDFLRDLDRLGPGGERLILFFASTIGNLLPEEVPGFLASVARQMAPGDGFLVGFDLVKDVGRLERAYDDAAGITAEFNKNILLVVNRRFGADFDPAAFEHVAFYDPGRQWIEMRLRALRDVWVRVAAAGRSFAFPTGSEIRTEVSCKFTRPGVEAAAAGAGLGVRSWYTDPGRLFALALLGHTGHTNRARVGALELPSHEE
jgi:L-histidine N-alpha-methyltransferase